MEDAKENTSFQRYQKLLRKFGSEDLLEPSNSKDDERTGKLANIFKFVGMLVNFRDHNHPLNPDTHPDIDRECYELSELVVKYFPKTVKKWVEKSLVAMKSAPDDYHRSLLAKEFYRWEKAYWENSPKLYQEARAIVTFPWDPPASAIKK